jgi:hypothetical protein
MMDQMNHDLVRINSRLGRVRSFLQVGIVDSPAAPSQSNFKSTVVNAMKSVSKPASSMAKQITPQKQETKSFDPEAVVLQMDSLSKVGKASLPAMLGLVSEVYDGWKEKIGSANKHEKEQKKEFDATLQELEMKKNDNAHKGDANWTETYDKIEKYWSLQRKIAHRQYHTVLKIAHAGMDKFKTVMHAMQSAIDSKKPDPKTMKKLQSMEMPEVVLLQKVESLTRWSHDAISLLHDAKNA